MKAALGASLQQKCHRSKTVSHDLSPQKAAELEAVLGELRALRELLKQSGV